METSEDQDLLDRARSQDAPIARSAWQSLYEQHCDEIYAFLHYLLKDENAAEDMLQETFLRAFRHLQQLNSNTSFKGWVRRIARNNAMDHLRAKRKAIQLQDLAAVESGGTGVSDELALRESLGSTQRALETLSLEDRLLLVQRYGQGMKLAELGEAMACTERTVRNRINRAAGRLARAVLAERKGGA